MYQTIQVSSCVSVQGEFVESLADGQVVIRVGEAEYRGHPIVQRPLGRNLRPEIVATRQIGAGLR